MVYEINGDDCSDTIINAYEHIEYCNPAFKQAVAAERF